SNSSAKIRLRIKAPAVHRTDPSQTSTPVVSQASASERCPLRSRTVGDSTKLHTPSTPTSSNSGPVSARAKSGRRTSVTVNANPGANSSVRPRSRMGSRTQEPPTATPPRSVNKRKGTIPEHDHAVGQRHPLVRQHHTPGPLTTNDVSGASLCNGAVGEFP
ncbi:MAG: hypothetical protein ACJATT_003838, partial [Myxococcota bacterium]